MPTRTNHIDLIGPRFEGRKGRSTPRSNPDQCDFRVGGKTKLIYVRRKNPKPGERKVAQIPVVEGGKRCTNLAVTTGKGKKRCTTHIGAEYPLKNDPNEGE